MDIWKYEDLPLFKTDSFNFYRCVEFDNNLYGKTISELHLGNLRVSRTDNRYSQLFPGQKLSYWADSPATARAEVKKWRASNNLLTFWAYDDGSTFIPTLYPVSQLKIIDGIQLEFREILDKMDNNLQLNKEEQLLIDILGREEPDCLVYESEARKNGLCFLFFEKGFRKLSLRKVSLRFGDLKGKNQIAVQCAVGSDFSPNLESYGYYFKPIARKMLNKNYYDSEEYNLRKFGKEKSMREIRKELK